MLWFTKSVWFILRVFGSWRLSRPNFFAFVQIAWNIKSDYSIKCDITNGLGLVWFNFRHISSTLNRCMCNKHAIPSFLLIRILWSHESFRFFTWFYCMFMSTHSSFWWFVLFFCYFIEFHFHSLYFNLFLCREVIRLTNHNIWNGPFVKVTQTPNLFAHALSNWTRRK